MNIFQKALKDKSERQQERQQELKFAHIGVSAKITTLIRINPMDDDIYEFDQVGGYIFGNSPLTNSKLNKWNIHKKIYKPSIIYLGGSFDTEELDYTSKDETDKFFKGLNDILQSDESKFAG